ncbi:MAG TPA: VWA domain-containing protein [Blastocatellia bacterium]|jgi:secreted protein with Ig-like and vWFA domain|nr:VWA domain-containing protein [Blastocatellia bacterium]
MIEFTNPIALLLLGLIPAALYFTRHSLANLSGLRGAVSISVRVLILLLVVLALGGFRLRSSSRDLALIFVVDLSASTSPDEQRDVVDFINREIDRASARDYLGVVAFARDALVELAPTRKEVLGDWRLTGISSNPAREYTDIAGALRLAAALVPETAAGRLILLSDGNENLASAVEESRLLKAEGVEVYTRYMRTVSERTAQHGEVAVRELAAPQMPAEGEAFDLKATIDSTQDTDAVLRVFRNDSVVAERPVHLSAEGENIFVMPQRLDQKGFYTYRAEIEATQADGFVQNNSREAFALVEGRPRALYLYGDRQPSQGLMRVLTEGNFAPDVRPPGGLPTKLAGFQNYDLVIFDNVPATALTEDQMKMVQSYVKDLGGGFMMIGGDQSFGPGGYFKTPIEETLPVSLDVRQKKHFPSLALALVIDKSGSMLGTKIQLAVEAASAAVDFLSERDSVEVIAFDDSAHAVVKLTKVEDKKAITGEITTIQAIGGTNIYAGLEMARASLAASDAQIKHIILLSDGQSEGNYPTIVRRIIEAGITLSSVAIGEDADLSLMKMLAHQGGGRFYATDAAENLPRIFTREAFLASRSTLIEEPFTPRLVRSTQATSGLDWSAAPQLGGYVGTAERDSLQSPAITSLVSDKDDPVYAVWQYGLGRAAAFTSDAKSRWAGGWMSWSGFGQFWTQAMRDTIRRESTGNLVPRVEINAGKGRVTVEALTPEGGYRNSLRLRARVVGPDLSAQEITLDQTAAGRYEGEFTAAGRGAYLVSVTEEGGEAAPVTGSVNSYSPEFGISRGDASLLARISEDTGGRVISDRPAAGNDSDTDLFERRALKHRPREIWEALMLSALLLLPFDVGVRRLHLTREQLGEARAWLASKLGRPSAEDADAETAVSHAQLKDARTRLKLGDEGPVSLDLGAQVPPPSRAEPLDEDGKESTAKPALPESIAESSEEPGGSEEPQTLASRLLELKRRKPR